jgi:hypothetical protein
MMQQKTTLKRNRLTPEEDSIGDPGDQDDEIDDLLPADLWFRTKRPKEPGSEP